MRDTEELIKTKKKRITNEKLVGLDFALKYLFRDRNDFELMGEFITNILNEAGYDLKIKVLNYCDTESNKEQSNQKKSIADLLVEDQYGNRYIIEIDRQRTRSFLHKVCFNTSRVIVDQAPSGDNFDKIKKVFHISLIYFKLTDDIFYHGKTTIISPKSKKPCKLYIKSEDGSINTKSQIYDCVVELRASSSVT